MDRMDTAGSVTSYWIGFFKDSGIPAGDAANYAVTFTDNRIQPDMLMDLNKEYLHDMGISVLGDVISILKHAKAVHTQLSREKVLKGTSHLTPQRPARSSPIPKRSTAASRFVDHYLGSDPMAAPMNEPGSPLVTVETEPEPPSVIRLKPRLSEMVPVPKSRRVFPEQEGRYKITMPQGTTEKTKKILESRRLSDPVGRKSSVFERLGGSDTTKVTVTGLGTGMVVKTTPEPSVFNRLGGKTVIKRAATSTSQDLDSDDDSDKNRSPALAYAGVLKNASSPAKKKKVVKKPVPKTTKKFDPLVSTQGILSDDARLEDKSVKARLGNMVSAADSSTGTGSRVKKTTAKKSGGISVRLGPKKSTTKSSADSTVKVKPATSGVFSRLGKHVS